jgi:hypothetical protein
MSYEDCSPEFVAEMEDLKIQADKDARETAETFDIYDEEEKERLYEILSSLERINLISESFTNHLSLQLKEEEAQVDRLMTILMAVAPLLPWETQEQIQPLIHTYKETRGH